jgi:hypothetical protein
MTRPITTARMRRLMDGPDAPEPAYGAIVGDPVIRVLLRHREEVAQATERAYRELRRLGVPDPAVLLLGDH